MHVYFDNAASSPLDPEVFDAMVPWLKDNYGNPSSIHSHGRQARAAIESARKIVSGILNVTPSEIFFTSGGTESDNTALICSVQGLSVNQIITTPIEHHAVLHCAQALEKAGAVKLHYVNLLPDGMVDYDHLQSLLSQQMNCMVALMHANNELGNLTDLERVGDLCSLSKAVFLSDTVQTIGHLLIDIRKSNLDFITGSAHKFHGPKGTGFLFISENRKIQPLLHGGSQERNMRGGTENVAGIVGLSVAMKLAYENMEKDKLHILNLKSRMIGKLKQVIPGVQFNGTSENLENSLYTILNASFPESDNNDMLLFNMDINKISASGGSACTSGTDIGSHVLNFLKVNPRRGHVRFSFSRYNTEEEVDYVVSKVEEILREWKSI